MVWHIVKFLKEDSVEAVPTSWYKSETLACYWPPSGTKTDQILRYIKHLHSPLGTWLLHSATLLGTYGKILFCLYFRKIPTFLLKKIYL